MGNAKAWRGFVMGLLVAVGYSGSAWSQSVTPVPLGANPFGENISSYDGSLSFDETDVSLPGNGPALITARSLSTSNPHSFSFNAERPFGDWNFNIPRIETAVVAKLQRGSTGWITNNGLSTGNRCSDFGVPATVSPIQGGDTWELDQWWYGYHLIVPGVGSQRQVKKGSHYYFEMKAHIGVGRGVGIGACGDHDTGQCDGCDQTNKLLRGEEDSCGRMLATPGQTNAKR